MCLVCTGCGTEDDPESRLVGNRVDFGAEDYKIMTTANNVLGFNLLDHVEPDESGNTFISPSSFFMAMLMVYNGADGVTKKEIGSALQLEGMDLDELNKANASLLDMLDKDTDHIQIQIANSIWVDDSFKLQDAYQKLNKDYLHADVNSIDVSDEASADKINGWVKDATDDTIANIIDPPLNKDMAALLLNGIYFKGDWTYPFNPDETEGHPFFPGSGKESEVEMMTLHEDDLAYMENDTFQAVSLPYGEGEMSMNIFLPKDDDGLKTFKKDITNDEWVEWMNEFREQEGTIQLPKFELEFETTLNDQVEKLGIKTALTKEADFSNMIKEDNPIKLSKIKQKTFLNVDETGTEAAGATSAEMETTSASIDEPFNMTVDKPFFMAITGDEMNIILFMGIINRPEVQG